MNCPQSISIFLTFISLSSFNIFIFVNPVVILLILFLIYRFLQIKISLYFVIKISHSIFLFIFLSLSLFVFESQCTRIQLAFNTIHINDIQTVNVWFIFMQMNVVSIVYTTLLFVYLIVIYSCCSPLLHVLVRICKTDLLFGKVADRFD